MPDASAVQQRHRADAVDVVVLALICAVAATGVSAFVLATLGWFRWWAAVLPVAAAAAVVVKARWIPLRHALRSAHRGWILLIPVIAVAALMFFPGSRYATSDKDPGIYVLHGLSIAGSGQLRIEATPLQRAGVFTVSDVPGAQWRGFGPMVDGSLRPSFYHLWPALLAVGFDAVGFGALAVVVPLIGLLSVVASFAVGRRLGGMPVGVVTAAVLATNMLNVWQAKYPTTEMLGQMLVLGAALALMMSLQTGSRVAGASCGALLAVGFLNRGEGVVLVLLAAAALAVAEVVRPAHRSVRSMAWGLALATPLALWQAYGPAATYSSVNGVPPARTVVALLLLALTGPWVVRRALPRLGAALTMVARRLASTSRWLLGAAIVVGAALAYYRRELFGIDYVMRNGEPIRSYDEESLLRLSLFFGWPALVLALLGALWALTVRPTRDRVLVTGTGLAFLALFLVQAKNSPQMMWWGRRFIPVAVPALALFIGCSLAALISLANWLVRHRSSWLRGVVVAVACLPALVAVVDGARRSRPLIGHDERAGSYTAVERIAAIAGGKPAVFLWERGPCCSSSSHLFGGALTILTGVDSALLPTDPAERPAFIRAVQQAAPDATIYVLTDRSVDGLFAPDLGLVSVDEIEGSVMALEERNDIRPRTLNPLPYDIKVYEVGTGGD